MYPFYQVVQVHNNRQSTRVMRASRNLTGSTPYQLKRLSSKTMFKILGKSLACNEEDETPFKLSSSIT